uniref:Uncharacterized protein n=1 Tax=Rhizophora mucronata TaxID=61149 RepID=A0A2P2N0T0_RHIMU
MNFDILLVTLGCKNVKVSMADWWNSFLTNSWIQPEGAPLHKHHDLPLYMKRESNEKLTIILLL